VQIIESGMSGHIIDFAKSSDVETSRFALGALANIVDDNQFHDVVAAKAGVVHTLITLTNSPTLSLAREASRALSNVFSSMVAQNDFLNEYLAIVARLVGTTPSNGEAAAAAMVNDEFGNDKLKKRRMKECVTLASSYLRQTLGIDVSVIDVEIVLDTETVIVTVGALACCFLDAGCARVVIPVREDGGNLDRALEAGNSTRVPRDRLVLHHCSVDSFGRRIHDIEEKVGTISVSVHADLISTVGISVSLLPLLQVGKSKVVVHLNALGATIDKLDLSGVSVVEIPA